MTHTQAAPSIKRLRKNRRVEILEKATALFGEYGFEGTTLARVAEAVGMTEPGILHYFPSKVHLLLGVLKYRDDKDIDKYAPLIQAEKKTVAELFALLEDVYGQSEQIPGLIQLFAVLVGESIRSDHPSHAYFVERYRRGRELYVQQFTRLSPAELRREVDPAELAALIMAVVDGLQIQWLLDPEKVNLSASLRLFLKIASAYLTPAPTAAPPESDNPASHASPNPTSAGAE